jgi:hypothetical protein
MIWNYTLEGTFMDSAKWTPRWAKKDKTWNCSKPVTKNFTRRVFKKNIRRFVN